VNGRRLWDGIGISVLVFLEVGGHVHVPSEMDEYYGLDWFKERREGTRGWLEGALLLLRFTSQGGLEGLISQTTADNEVILGIDLSWGP
jgi:hypothetical protein